MIQARARQGKVSGLIPCRYRSTQKEPGVSEPPLVRRALHQVSARFRPRPGRTHQLSARSTSLPRPPTTAERYRFVPTVENWRDRMKPAASHKLPRGTSSLRSSRGSNLHCVPVLADRARAWRQNKNGRETTSGQKIISPRCFARARHSNTARGVACRRRRKQ